MKMGGVNRSGQLHRISRTLNIYGNLTRLIGPQVIDRSQMIKMVNMALERLDAVCGYAELLDGQVAKHRHYTGRAHAPVLPQVGYFVFAFPANQIMDHRAFAL